MRFNLIMSFLACALLLIGFQNCSENPNGFTSSTQASNLDCQPTGNCLSFALEMAESTDKKTSRVCIYPDEKKNGKGSAPRFSPGCTVYTDTCYFCAINAAHEVFFQVSASESKLGENQSISVHFTPSGKAQVIGN